MSGYTYASGIMTATVTARCPECNAVKVVPFTARLERASTVDPCCSVKHLRAYLRKCRKTATMLRQAQGRKRYNNLDAAYIKRSMSLPDRVAQFAVDHEISYRTL